MNQNTGKDEIKEFMTGGGKQKKAAEPEEEKTQLRAVHRCGCGTDPYGSDLCGSWDLCVRGAGRSGLHSGTARSDSGEMFL